jgi:hypothetical protein
VDVDSGKTAVANFRHHRQNSCMPTVMRIGPYRLHFFSREGHEPPHIHITREEMEAKIWLRPVALESNYGFAKSELVRIEKPVAEHCQHCQKLLEAYIQIHGC